MIWTGGESEEKSRKFRIVDTNQVGDWCGMKMLKRRWNTELILERDHQEDWMQEKKTVTRCNHSLLPLPLPLPVLVLSFFLKVPQPRFQKQNTHGPTENFHKLLSSKTPRASDTESTSPRLVGVSFPPTDWPWGVLLPRSHWGTRGQGD